MKALHVLQALATDQRLTNEEREAIALALDLIDSVAVADFPTRDFSLVSGVVHRRTLEGLGITSFQVSGGSIAPTGKA